MLKKRIIPKFLLRGGRLVKGVRFHENFREAGNPVSTAKIYDSYGVDELIFLDIEATVNSQATMVDIVERVSRDIFMPFTVGGGVRTIYLAVNHLREVIEAHFGDGSGFGCTIAYLREDPSDPRGTGGALAMLPAEVLEAEDPILVMNGDLVTQFDVRLILDANATLLHFH